MATQKSEGGRRWALETCGTCWYRPVSYCRKRPPREHRFMDGFGRQTAYAPVNADCPACSEHRPAPTISRADVHHILEQGSAVIDPETADMLIDGLRCGAETAKELAALVIEEAERIKLGAE